MALNIVSVQATHPACGCGVYVSNGIIKVKHFWLTVTFIFIDRCPLHFGSRTGRQDSDACAFYHLPTHTQLESALIQLGIEAI